MLEVVAHTCKSNMEVGREEGLLGSWAITPSLIDEFQVKVRGFASKTTIGKLSCPYEM